MEAPIIATVKDDAFGVRRSALGAMLVLVLVLEEWGQWDGAR